jgi:hypothetical protein
LNINGAIIKEFLKPDVPISISYQKLLELSEEICEKFVLPNSFQKPFLWLKTMALRKIA